MQREVMINTIGLEYKTANTEVGEWNYATACGGRNILIEKLGRENEHETVDIRFVDENNGLVVLVETKKIFVYSDIQQLSEYVDIEKAVYPEHTKIVAILANTKNDDIRVWKGEVSDSTELTNETVLDNISHYRRLFVDNKTNNRELVLKNTYALNELLHKKDIHENLRSQFVGTVLLYIKHLVNAMGITDIDSDARDGILNILKFQSERAIVAGIEDTLSNLLDGSDNKQKKIELLQHNVLDNQKIRGLTKKDWLEIIEFVLMKIYRYIDSKTKEGQDILNLFFITFNKYTGKSDKNQAFTPDHITEFMCRLTEINRDTRVLDATCGSASFLVQAMVKELADCERNTTESECKKLQDIVKKEHIYGIEIEENAYGLAVTNMLIHGDGNSNIKLGSCFDCKDFIKKADPDVILLNPPYNAKPKGIPAKYKETWGKDTDKKEDASKGLVFVRYLSDVIKELNEERTKKGMSAKTVKLAVLLPLSAAIGSKSILKAEKKLLLKDNTLEAVFSLPAEIFYPGASVCACCMLFTLGQPHIKPNGKSRSTFFGYCKEDGFVKKKNLGRVEQFNKDGTSLWKAIEEEWLDLFEEKITKDGKSAVQVVSGEDEWLCEAYMKTDYSTLCKADFQRTLNNYLAYQIKSGLL